MLMAYASVITDLAALVAVHTDQYSLLDSIRLGVGMESQLAAQQSATNAHDRAQYEADSAAVEKYRAQQQVEVSALAALPPEQQQRTRLSWVWWDGTALPPAPADETLASAAALLARDDAALPVRAAAITAAEAAEAEESVRVAGLVADLEGLRAQLDPATAGPAS